MIEIRAVSPITVDSACFDYADVGPLAHIFPVDTPAGDVIDAVAFFPQQPTQWWLLNGVAEVLGEPDLLRASFRADPILLVETPQDWVQTPNSACIVDWSCDPRFALRLVTDVECATPRLEHRLRRRIRECSQPNFRISSRHDVQRAA